MQRMRAIVMTLSIKQNALKRRVSKSRILYESLKCKKV